MKGSLKPRVKICCISSQEEAMMAINYGASALGLVGNMPSGPGVICNELIKEIVSIVPSSISSFLLTSETSSKKIIKHYQKVKTNAIQIVDKLKEGSYKEIRDTLPNIKLVQVIHVIDEKSIEEAIKVSKFVDIILLDSGNPNLKIKELGGTGRVHNWNLSKIIRQEINIPLFLAGGLNKNNVRQAIEYVKPFGIDICSGVRTNGNLDQTKVKEFFQVVNSH